VDKNLEKYLTSLILSKNYVNGYSRVLHNKIVKGRETNEKSIRFYVSKKLPVHSLNKKDILPLRINDISVDVVEAGKWKLVPPLRVVKKPSKTTRIRPLEAGISIGNLSITAGSLGWYYKKGKKTLAGSNAHVFSEDPSKKSSKEKRIVQPGHYDGGTAKDMIGHYVWHKQVHPIGEGSNCTLSNSITKFLNGLYSLFNRKTRFSTYLQVSNHIDFAVSTLEVPYSEKFIDYDISQGFYGVGHGFAGSDKTSLICKGKYIEEEGYSPVKTSFVTPKKGDIVYKTGRTSCFNSARIIDTSGVSQVSYGSFVALFSDVIVTEHLLDPGDSGSFAWLKEVK